MCTNLNRFLYSYLRQSNFLKCFNPEINVVGMFEVETSDLLWVTNKNNSLNWKCYLVFGLIQIINSLFRQHLWSIIVAKLAQYYSIP